MSASEIVIASAKRTAVGSFNGAFANTPAHELGAAAIKAALEAARVDAAEVDEVILGQILSAAQGQNPGAPGRDEGRRSPGKDRLRHQPIVRQRPARRRARPAADRQRRRRDHRRRRAGIDVAGAARRASAQRRQDGRNEIRRHHAQGRADRRVPRLSHGQHRREHRRQMADQPRGAGPLRRRHRRTRPRRRRRPAASRTRSRRSRSRPARATSSSPTTSSSAPARPTKRSPSSAPPSPRTAR